MGKIDIFARGLTDGFGPKMAIFSIFFFRQYRPGKCVLWYSRSKKRLLRRLKRRSPKSRKIDIFSKRLTHGFGPKMAIFGTFFLGNIGLKNFFYDILERKSAFLGYKNKKSKKWKNWHLSKAVNPWFLSKNGHISNPFFFRQYRPGKCFLWYSRKKKGLLRR